MIELPKVKTHFFVRAAAIAIKGWIHYLGKYSCYITVYKITKLAAFCLEGAFIVFVVEGVLPEVAAVLVGRTQEDGDVWPARPVGKGVWRHRAARLRQVVKVLKSHPSKHVKDKHGDPMSRPEQNGMEFLSGMEPWVLSVLPCPYF